VTAEALSEWLNDRVARYQRPRSIQLRPEPPLTPVGKRALSR
jgi:acyl-CoA synthetase (AMP-forming)/AMP-acid ligase II